MDIKEVVERHQKWLNGEPGGKRANLNKADLRGVDLSGADLRWASLKWANLSEAILSETILIWTDLRWANLSKAILNDADLSESDLRWVNLSDACLCKANLNKSDLSEINLRGANLRWANLSEAILRWADLSLADLSEANLNRTNLSGAKGLLSQSEYIRNNFDRTNEGIIVYKTFDEYYPISRNWIIEPNSFITETVNSNRTDKCGCGINVGTKDHILTRMTGEIWECLIEWLDLAGVVVPYNTDGKIRAERVKLLRTVPREELIK